MTRYGNVRSIVVGGRPAVGPMQPDGGTKGSAVLSLEELEAYADAVLSSSSTSAADRQEVSVLGSH